MPHIPFKRHFVILFTGILLIGVMIPLATFAKSSLGQQPHFTHATQALPRSTTPQHFISPSGSGSVAPYQQINPLQLPQISRTRQGSVVPLNSLPDAGHPIPVAQGEGAVTDVAPSNTTQSNTVSYTSFAGQDEPFSGGISPSDANAGAGPSNIVQVVNTQVASYTPTGGLQFAKSFDSWFGQSSFLVDPKVVYDPWGKRFILMVLVSSGHDLFLSVSKQTDATGSWCNYDFPTAGSGPDFNELGVGPNGIYFSVTITSGPTYDELFSVNRTQMESCQTPSYTTWTSLTNPDGSLAHHIAPAVMYSSSSYEYLVNALNNGGCSLTLWRLEGSSLSNSSIPTYCYTFSSPAQQKGTTATLVPGYLMLYQANFLNGMLATALGSGHTWSNVTSTSVVLWFEIDTTNLSLARQGHLGHAGIWYWFPAIALDSNGNMVIVFDASNAAMYPSIRYVIISSTGALVGNALLVSGKGYFGTNAEQRWGDYQSAVLDPGTKTRIWICGQYGEATNVWGTWIGEVGA